MLTCQVFRCLMILSDFLVCMAHGSNDVGNAISPLIVIESLEPGYNEYIPFLVGSLGIAFGLLLMGEKVMQTIGEDVILLDYMKGFCSQFATAVCVCLGSSLGIPLSTTHCIVGALAGVHIASKTPYMRAAYLKKPQTQEEEDFSSPGLRESASTNAEVPPKAKVRDESAKMNLQTIKKILLWWAITIPFAMGTTSLICYLLLKV